jgi:ribonucleotide monophosphatase NagD (HAD superfamily)
VEKKNNILSMTGDYETLFIDAYGVLYDGISMYDHVLPILERLKKDGKKIVILSNSTQVSKDMKTKYVQKGMIQNVHYDELITSGEFLHYTIMEHPDEFSKIMEGRSETVKCIFVGNSGVFADTHLTEVDMQDADFLYVGVPRASCGAVRIDDIWDKNGNKINIEDILENDWNDLQDSHGHKGLAEFAHILNNCLRLNKTLLVSNPDIFSCSFDYHTRKCIAIITQGAIGAYYEKLGGRVVYFGKPYSGIFEYAKQVVKSSKSILMIGDTPWTDISGANACGLDTALVLTTGVSNEFISRMDDSLPVQEKYRLLFEQIAPKMARISYNVWPKYCISCFAGESLY